MNLRIGRISARLAALLAPGCCLRCKTPWLFVKSHVTDYSISSGCFPLCEKCWSELTPDQRLPFYRELITRWFAHGSLDGESFAQTWHQVKTAVLNGS